MSWEGCGLGGSTSGLRQSVNQSTNTYLGDENTSECVSRRASGLSSRLYPTMPLSAYLWLCKCNECDAALEGSSDYRRGALLHSLLPGLMTGFTELGKAESGKLIGFSLRTVSTHSADVRYVRWKWSAWGGGVWLLCGIRGVDNLKTLDPSARTHHGLSGVS